MAEFYVTYDQEAGKFLAIIVAPQAPAKWQFASRDELIAAMESLDHEWQLLSEMPVPEHFKFDNEVAGSPRKACRNAGNQRFAKAR